MARLLLLPLLALLALPVRAQVPAPVTPSDPAPLVLTLDEAVELALIRGYAVRDAALDVENARLQVREAWGQILPNVSSNASYTRNVVQANPFAGSDAGGLFGALGAVDWLAFNERARTDGDPSTEPISFEEFLERQQAGFETAGVSVGGSDNPFGVPNQFTGTVSISQPIYNGAAFAAVRGARSLRAINEVGLVAEQQRTIHEVRQLYYTALLAQEQAAVQRASVERARATEAETARRVAAGTLPRLEELSAEVEVANAEAQLMQVENQAALASTNLLFVIGLPVDRPVALRGSLDLPAEALVQPISLDEAVAVAVERRPDLEQLRLAVELQQVNRDITRAAGRPALSAFADLGLIGSVPDDRTLVQQGAVEPGGDPFAVTVEERGFFDSSYWNPNVAVGARVTWTLFDGFQTRYRVQQNTIEIQRAELQREQALQGAVLEIEQAIRSIDAARRRVAATATAVDAAETAFDFASRRLTAGVATQLDVRLASNQLDQARLGYLQAVYDLLVARSELERATGVVTPDPEAPDAPRPLAPPFTTTSAD